jgi:F0F1-type ATP synthase alpha subunit
MLEHIRSRHADVLQAVRSTGKLEDDVEKKLAAALDEFAKTFQPTRVGQPAPAAEGRPGTAAKT